MTDTISFSEAKKLVQAGVIFKAHIIGSVKGWIIELTSQNGVSYRLRSNRVPNRIFVKFETLIALLFKLGIMTATVDYTDWVQHQNDG